MPVLLRAAHVDDVPPGTSRVVRVRGDRVRLVHVGTEWAAFDAEKAKMDERAGEADLVWARQHGAAEYRVVVRGSFVHVALDARPGAAPAEIQQNDREPQRVNPA